ncbi:MAG TPA: L-threonylcarbamoyladenylate synthase [Candidatus Saccharimonadales bacterium]|nr:L-threonylcarbamoyladenylate synthase [Candidatus Saccharimonadales bacterium]
MAEEEKAAEVLNRGGLVIFPTETVFGIGCLINNKETVARLYRLKKREESQPTLALVKNLEMAQSWVEFNGKALELVESFWPGPLTIALPCRKNVSEELLGPGNSLAVRVSSNTFIKELFELIDQPLLAPSANFKGEQAPRKLSEIDKSLASKVDYVVPVEPEGAQPSTIISFAGSGYNIVREGSISKKQLKI